jgi:hypothetical protein
MLCTPGPVFGGTGGVGSRFHVLHARTHFRRYLGRRVQFTCFALPDSFSAVPMASGPVFMLCAPGPVFGNIKGVRFCFHVLRSRTRFRRYRWCQVPFSCFVLPDLFSAVQRASGPVFMFCAPVLVFGGIEGVRSRFNIFRARTHFRRCRARRVPLSCFALSDSFLAVPKASGHVFNVLRVRTCFLWNRGRRVPFSYFARTDSFLGVSCASGPYFMFCALVLVFNGTEDVGSRFHVLLSGLVFSGTEGVRSRFHVLLPELFFGGTEGVRSRFHVLLAPTHFRRYRGRQVPFSCYARPVSFSTVPMASGPDLKFSASGLIFGGTEGVWSRFHVLRARTHIRRYGGRRVPF